MTFYKLSNPPKQRRDWETEHYPRSGVFVFPIPAVIISHCPDGAGPWSDRWVQSPPCKRANKAVRPSCLGRYLAVILRMLISAVRSVGKRASSFPHSGVLALPKHGRGEANQDECRN